MRARRVGGLGVAVGVAAFAVHNLLDFTFFLPSAAWTAAFLAGWCHGRADEPAPTPGTVAGRLAPWAVAAAAAVVSIGAGLSSGDALGARLAAPSPERRIELSRRAVARAPWSADAALFHARVLGASNLAPDDAVLAAADRAVRLAPNRAAARAHRAGQRLRRGDGPGALADLREAVRLHPGEPTYRRDLGVVANRLRQQVEAAPR